MRTPISQSRAKNNGKLFNIYFNSNHQVFKKKPTKKRGGARPGAGRPKKEPTVVITRRVPLKFADQFRLDIDNLLKSYVKEQNT